MYIRMYMIGICNIYIKRENAYRILTGKLHCYALKEKKGKSEKGSTPKNVDFSRLTTFLHCFLFDTVHLLLTALLL
jgi:hypothetical protein